MRVIAGPCQHESYEHSLEIAKECQRICHEHDIQYIFKASFDKANRTSMSGKRGLGLAKTMRDFEKLASDVDYLLTDVHDEAQIDIVKEFVDVIQIPAFLCRQTDLIRAAVDSECTINIKKGQFLAPWDVEGILSKTQDADEVWITERGTSFGYNNLVVDFTGLQYMIDHYDVPIVFDATHSVQKPGGEGSSSGGNRNYVRPLCRAAAALGVKNFFLEVHPDPNNAPSDGSNMLHLKDFETTIKEIKRYSYK